MVDLSLMFAGPLNYIVMALDILNQYDLYMLFIAFLYFFATPYLKNKICGKEFWHLETKQERLARRAAEKEKEEAAKKAEENNDESVTKDEEEKDEAVNKEEEKKDEAVNKVEETKDETETPANNEEKKQS